MWFLVGLSLSLNLIVAVGVVVVWIELRAMKLSTHKIQYIDPYAQWKNEKAQELTEEDKKRLEADFFDTIT